MGMIPFGKSKAKLSPLKNPFAKDKITSIDLDYRKATFEKYWAWRATIKFSNGDTSGVQRFKVTDVESDDAFEDVTKKVQEFINSL